MGAVSAIAPPLFCALVRAQIKFNSLVPVNTSAGRLLRARADRTFYQAETSFVQARCVSTGYMRFNHQQFPPLMGGVIPGPPNHQASEALARSNQTG